MRVQKDQDKLLILLNALRHLNENNPELDMKILDYLRARVCADGGHGKCDKFDDFNVVVIVSKNE